MRTIKVKPWADDQGDYVLINATDFDPAVHERIAAEPEAESGTAEAANAAKPRRARSQAVAPEAGRSASAAGASTR